MVKELTFAISCFFLSFLCPALPLLLPAVMKVLQAMKAEDLRGWEQDYTIPIPQTSFNLLFFMFDSYTDLHWTVMVTVEETALLRSSWTLHV